MKHSILLFLLGVAMSAMSQNVVNGGFESWTNKVLYEEPDTFVTYNPMLYQYGYDMTATKTTDAHGGSYALHLETTVFDDDTIPGVAMLSTEPFGNSITGVPYSFVPDSVSAWVKHNIAPADSGIILALFMTAGSYVGSCEIVIKGSEPSWTKVGNSVNWFSFSIPDTIIMIIGSSNFFAGIGVPGSWLVIDDIEMGSPGPIPAEQIPNAGFEYWRTIQFEEADGWYSMNYASTSGLMAQKTTDSHQGLYAMQLKTVKTHFYDTIGFITNGKFGDNGPEGGLRVYQNADKVSGYYKYNPVGNDTALAGVMTWRYDHALDDMIMIEERIIPLPPAMSYTYFEIDLTYNDWPLVDTVTIAFASSNMEGDYIGLGSELFLDDIHIDLLPLGTVENKEGSIKAWPNPCVGSFVIEGDQFLGLETEVVLYSSKGQAIAGKKYRVSFTGNGIMIDVSQLAAGSYIYQVKSNKGLYSGKVVVQ